MKRILITGMSGTGKSSVIEELKRRGYESIDTDSDAWCEWVSVSPAESSVGAEPERDWVWKEQEMTALLRQERSGPLFVCGCKSNQGKFYSLFDHIVLLSGPAEVLLDRVATRTTNPYGKSEAERALIIHFIEVVEPLLRAGCDLELDTSKLDIHQVADELRKLAQGQNTAQDASPRA
jgi:RNase adaptor protein for sRNA GlmZ degradation